MDHIEKIAVRQAIEQTLNSAEAIKAQRQKLHKLLRSPYFGRFDFHKSGEANSEPVYIGVHHFRDEAARETRCGSETFFKRRSRQAAISVGASMRNDTSAIGSRRMTLIILCSRTTPCFFELTSRL
ncbi:MAG: hypothetical protein RRB22_15640 [Gammaproteobacteria bacterium]|nr:hypothetical protein [Gammaproteobacteria bacterium]